jgi:hypothetical protein
MRISRKHMEKWSVVPLNFNLVTVIKLIMKFRTNCCIYENQS